MTPHPEPVAPPPRAIDAVFPPDTEMGRLCRRMDWAATPLGPVERWPQSLKTAAGMVISQGIAQNLCWGPELLQIYNDAYRVIMGDKHPAGLGRSVLWSWAEIRDQIAPLFERVFGGETVYFEDLRLRVQRHGALEDAFFTFSYSPVRVESGEVGAVLINCYETTGQVLARRRVEQLLSESERARAEAEAARAEAEAARRHLERVIAQAPVAMYIATGREHTFQVVNEPYYAMVGKRPEEVIGRPGREVFPELIGQGVFEIIDRVYDTGVPFTAPAIGAVFDADGDGVAEEHYFNLVYQPLRDGRGEVYAVALVATEVTELVRAREVAEAAQREAEEANRAKAEFLASMSHELRTPLNAIAGYVELVEMGVHGPVSPGQREALARVAANQRHLLTLINDILAYAKLEAGQVEFDLRPLAALELISSVEPLVAPLAQARGIDLAVEACDPGSHLVGDQERVRQILLNLVGNAIKFTPVGGWIRLSCERSGEWLDVHVRDNGPGIPAEKQQRIFDPFVQVDRRLSSPQEGVGLGLAISRDLARGMGGEMSVRSGPERGSVFTLRLPAASAPGEERG